MVCHECQSPFFPPSRHRSGPFFFFLFSSLCGAFSTSARLLSRGAADHGPSSSYRGHGGIAPFLSASGFWFSAHFCFVRNYQRSHRRPVSITVASAEKALSPPPIMKFLSRQARLWCRRMTRPNALASRPAPVCGRGGVFSFRPQGVTAGRFPTAERRLTGIHLRSTRRLGPTQALHLFAGWLLTSAMLTLCGQAEATRKKSQQAVLVSPPSLAWMLPGPRLTVKRFQRNERYSATSGYRSSLFSRNGGLRARNPPLITAGPEAALLRDSRQSAQPSGRLFLFCPPRRPDASFLIFFAFFFLG